MAYEPHPDYFVWNGMFRRCYDPRHVSFKYRVIAADYGVSRHMIGMVVRGDAWKDV